VIRGWRAGSGAGILWLALASVGAAAAPAGPRLARPPWLHLDAAPATESLITSSQLRLSAEREAVQREQGFGAIELWRRDELEWKDERTLSKRTLRVRQYLTNEGVRQSGNLDVGVRTQFEELWIEEAWTLLPDGRRRPVELDSIQLVTSGSDVFSDSVNVVIPFDGLVAGATVVLVTRIVERVAEWPLPWSEIFFPQGWAPIERYEFEMRWKASMVPRVLRTDAAFLQCQTGSGHASCRAERIPAVPGQGDSPIWLDVLPQLVVSASQSWTDLVLAEQALVERSIASDRGVKEALRPLLDGAKSEKETLDRIHRFVADRIRYLGLEHGSAAVAPTPAARTLDLRYGDCKGKVALLVAMARQAGIPAYPVLVSTVRSALDKLMLPSWKYFDHMIVCLEQVGARGPVCLDPTTADAPTGVLPPTLYGSVALDLRDDVDAPHEILAPPVVVDIDVRTENLLACDGNITEQLVRKHNGANAVWERRLLRGSTVEERTRWARYEYQSLLGNKTDPSFQWSGLDDPTQPVTVSSTTRFAGAFTRDRTEYYEPTDVWLRHYSMRFATTNTRYPWEVPGVQIQSTIRYRLCPSDRIGFVGAELDLRSEFGSLERKVQRTHQGVSVVSSLRLAPQTITGDRLERYRRFLERALAQTAVWFNVERSAQGGASR
jgi:transglutaminase-like putative cysteine protease